MAAVLHGDVVNQLLDDDRLADAGAAEDADLAALAERGDQVDDLDAGLEHFGRGLLLLEGGGWPVDRIVGVGHDVAGLVDRLAEHVEDPAEGRVTHGHPDRCAGVHRLDAPLQAVRRPHRHAPHPVVP